MPRERDLAEATASYEAWADRHATTSPEARAEKHALMAGGAFPFLRASYYRWVTQVAELPDPPGPVVTAVGDLHIENFGTWRDAEARLAWGVNDLDEADQLPAAHDLLRLATSVEVARAEARLAPGSQAAVELLLAGYETALQAGGRASVLERPDPPLIQALLPHRHGQRWWQRIEALPMAHDVPEAAIDVLRRGFPDGVGELDLRRRTAGMGSRDHLRVVAIAEVTGAPSVREVKALTPPATWWAGRRPKGAQRGEAASVLLRSAHRAPDPSLRITGDWSLRRLAPWSDRIEITDLRARTDIAALLQAMGGEVATLHLASTSARALRDLVGGTGRRWLTAATDRMVETTLADALAWAQLTKTGGLR